MLSHAREKDRPLAIEVRSLGVHPLSPVQLPHRRLEPSKTFFELRQEDRRHIGILVRVRSALERRPCFIQPPEPKQRVA
jgi:hypothetical protein